jgi:SAM-dependent methyltransferase
VDVVQALDRALAVLVPVLDVVEGRVTSGEPPAWCERRGLAGYLLGLSDDELARAESVGLARAPELLARAPEPLALLARDVAAAIDLPALAAPRVEAVGEAVRSVRARKREQLPSLLGAVRGMAEAATRIVDVGAGSGHFTRLAADAFDRDAVGLERAEARVEAAAVRAGEGARATFVAFDVGREELRFQEGDLAVGLHACGALGDRLVLAAARDGADLALVSCCLQKIDGAARPAISRRAADAGLVLGHEALGLSNLTPGEVGVETSLAATLAAREARHALALLLARRGLVVAPGEEMRGLNRRRARRGLAEIAPAALALRDEPPPTAAELAAASADARRDYARMRRLSLPRALLARLCEVALVLDRAAALVEAGHAARVGVAFDVAVSPRNLLLAASLDPRRLPAFERA